MRTDYNPNDIKVRVKKMYESGNRDQAVDLIITFVFEKFNENDENHTLIVQGIKELSEQWLVENITEQAYLIRALMHCGLKQYREMLNDATKAIEINCTYSQAYNYRGSASFFMKNYALAIEDFSMAIKLNSNYFNAFNNRGLAYLGLNNADLAIVDFKIAIELKPNHSFAYNNRGSAYLRQKEYDLAIKDFNKAIEITPGHLFAYNNRGNAYANKEFYDKAIEDYNQAIKINPCNYNAYYDRGNVFDKKGKYPNAITDYEKFLNLASKNKDSYHYETAEARIKELTRLLKESELKDIEEIVDSVKELLTYEGKEVTHYTSISTAEALILQASKLRLSEAAYLNDTSEGKVLYKYLGISKIGQPDDLEQPDLFIPQPFIGSFVPDSENDNLTLWRMYGKEKGKEAEGSAITLNREQLITDVRAAIISSGKEYDSIKINSDAFCFYRVAYKTNGGSAKFVIPEDKWKEAELNDLMRKLQKYFVKLKKKDITQDNRRWIMEKLGEIAYLFKTTEYQYEKEIRLVILGTGFPKQSNEGRTPPSIYIELVKVYANLTKVTLGPKVERPYEWAAAFHYKLKDAGNDADILISRLPYK